MISQPVAAGRATRRSSTVVRSAAGAAISTRLSGLTLALTTSVGGARQPPERPGRAEFLHCHSSEGGRISGLNRQVGHRPHALPERSTTRSCDGNAISCSPTERSTTGSRTGASLGSPVVAVVMVLQRLERLSGREAVERCCFDNRWRHAAGVGGTKRMVRPASPTSEIANRDRRVKHQSPRR
jgi:hypothetical protein